MSGKRAVPDAVFANWRGVGVMFGYESEARDNVTGDDVYFGLYGSSYLFRSCLDICSSIGYGM